MNNLNTYFIWVKSWDTVLKYFRDWWSLITEILVFLCEYFYINLDNKTILFTAHLNAVYCLLQLTKITLFSRRI